MTGGTGSQGQGPGEFPPMANALLDQAGVNALFEDIRTCTQVEEVRVRGSAREMTNAETNLELFAARDLLISGRVRGVQVRYAYDGGTWFDTLIVDPGGAGWRLVRVRHDGLSQG